MDKIITISEIPRVIVKLKKEGKKLVLAGGCFDILHVGHIEFIKKAKAAGDILVLLLESDESIKKLKGDKRPINNLKHRAQVLSSLESVDYVISLEKPYFDEDYEKLILQIKPDVIAITEGDPSEKKKNQHAKLVSGKVKAVLKNLPDHSTTKLLDYF